MRAIPVLLVGLLAGVLGWFHFHGSKPLTYPPDHDTGVHFTHPNPAWKMSVSDAEALVWTYADTQVSFASSRVRCVPGVNGWLYVCTYSRSEHLLWTRERVGVARIDGQTQIGALNLTGRIDPPLRRVSMATFLAEAQIACNHQAARQRRIVNDGSDSMYAQLLSTDQTFARDLDDAGFVAEGRRPWQLIEAVKAYSSDLTRLVQPSPFPRADLLALAGGDRRHLNALSRELGLSCHFA